MSWRALKLALVWWLFSQVGVIEARGWDALLAITSSSLVPRATTPWVQRPSQSWNYKHLWPGGYQNNYPAFLQKCPRATTNDISQEQQNSETRNANKEGGKVANNRTSTNRRNWDECYALLLEFYHENGHANVPGHYKEDPKFGGWLKAQRTRRHSLPSDKIAKLNALNITWDGVQKDKNDHRWKLMFQCLQEYKELEGHCCVPVTYKPNQKLANWVRRNRQMHRLGKLTPSRIESLESIGFVWRLREFKERNNVYLEEIWEQKFEELLAYRESNGHCRVPIEFRENPQLGFWVYTQRKWHNEGWIREDRKRRLEKIGFTWSFEEIYDEAWLSKYNQLVELKEEEKDTRAPSRHLAWASQSKQYELWTWEMNQQYYYRRGTLDNKRESMLDEIGYWDSLGVTRESLGS